MKLNFIERIKQLSLDIWRTSRNSEEILAEVTCTNDRLDKLEERLLNKKEEKKEADKNPLTELLKKCREAEKNNVNFTKED